MSWIKRNLKRVTGIQAYQDHKEAKRIKEFCEEKQEKYISMTESLQDEMNTRIERFAEYRLETLKDTLGVFLAYIEDIHQNNKKGYYEILEGCNIPESKIYELEQLHMNTTEFLKTAGTSSALAAVALSGVPTVVTGAVGTLATASTGTAIATLSGAAKTNAILAWLGGGSLATGGGGMAVGSAVLATATFTVAGIVAVVSGGLIASQVYSKKLTSAKEFEFKVEEACSKMEASWDAMNGIIRRVDEISDVTSELYDRIKTELPYLEPLIPDFNHHQNYHINTFQRVSLLMKSFSELAKAPLFDEEMELSGSTEKILIHTKQILNTEL